MAQSSWNLNTNSATSNKVDLHVSSQEIPGTTSGWSVTKRTLHGGLSEGVELLELNNGRLKLALVPTRGMGLWYAELDESRLGWQSPVRGPIHPRFIPLMEPSGVGWLDGFDELMVRCGLESNGSAVFNERGQLVYPLHGRVANRPAHSLSVTIDDTSGMIEVSAIVDEIRFHFQKLQLRESVASWRTGRWETLTPVVSSNY